MYQLIQQSERPNRLTPDKNEKYHLDMGRYAVSDAYDTRHNDWITQCNLNRSFWANNQWQLQEDLESFLKDGSDQSRNRIKVTINLISGQIAQYVGNAKNLNITMRAENLSYKAINRRETRLAELLFFTELARNSTPETSAFIKEKQPIGDTQAETEEIFSNLWTDEYTKIVNNFLRYIFEEEEIEKRKPELAFDLSLTGMNILKYEILNNEFTVRKTTPENFFWDKSAVEYDLSDGEYMGEVEYMSAVDIYEQYDLTEAQKELLEKSTKDISDSNPNTYINGGKIPVYKVYWKDTEQDEYGYVMDEFQYPYLTKINYIHEGQTEPRYTDKDLIPEKDLSEKQKEILKGKNKGTLNTDVVRFCHIIPNEILTGREKDKYSTSEVPDIVLDFGLLRYQDKDTLKAKSAKFPYKVYCWYYFKGFVYTPVNDLINPQRMINRYESVSENLMNTALPANMIYDKSMVDAQDGEAQLLRDKYQGKPTGLNAKGRGIHNAVTVSNSTLDTNSIRFNSMKSQEMAANMDKIIGLNEPMRGEGTGANQLVGVTAQQIQRSSLMQEPFYTAIVEVYKQMAQSIVNVARRLYSDNDRQLSIMIGDKGAELIKLSKEYATEAFRVFINHQQDEKQQEQAANQILMGMLAQGLISRERFADLYNRSTPEDIATAIRDQVREEKEVARIQSGQQQAIAQEEINSIEEAQFQQQQMRNQERDDKIIKEQLDRDAAIEKEIIKQNKAQ